VQALAPWASAGWIERCPGLEEVAGRRVCPPHETESKGRITFVEVDGVVVLVHGDVLDDDQLITIRDSVRPVTRAEVSAALTESNGSVWQFAW
jgi:hypothetical protein